MMKKTTLAITLCAMLLAGCERRELAYKGGAVMNVEVDWTGLCSYDKEKPQHLKALFYPVDGSQPVERYLPTAHGGQIRVPEGTYDIIVYNWRTNAEAQTVQFRGAEKYLTHKAYTAELEHRKQRGGARNWPPTPIIAQPDYLYVWTTKDAPQQILFKRGAKTVLKAPMKSLTHFYHFTLDIYNPDEIRSIESHIGKASGWVRLATGEISEGNYLTDVSITRQKGDAVKTKFLLAFRTFGLTKTPPLPIVIETTNSDGLKQQHLTKDINDIIDQIDKGIIDNTEPYDLSDPNKPVTVTPGKKPGSEGGFNPPTIGNWVPQPGGEIVM